MFNFISPKAIRIILTFKFFRGSNPFSMLANFFVAVLWTLCSCFTILSYPSGCHCSFSRHNEFKMLKRYFSCSHFSGVYIVHFDHPPLHLWDSFFPTCVFVAILSLFPLFYFIPLHPHFFFFQADIFTNIVFCSIYNPTFINKTFSLNDIVIKTNVDWD